MKTVRITAKYKTKDVEILKEALLALCKTDIITGPTTCHMQGSEIGTFNFMIESDKLEYPNEDNTQLIIIE